MLSKTKSISSGNQGPSATALLHPTELTIIALFVKMKKIGNVKCMVCCFLRHGPKYETVECTQDMHNERQKYIDLKPQKRKQELSCDAHTNLSIPEKF